MRQMTCAACPNTSPFPGPSNFETVGLISIQSDEEAEIPKILYFHNFCDNRQLFGEESLEITTLLRKKKL